MRIVCWQTIHHEISFLISFENIIPYFIRKLGKRSQNLLSAAVMIGTLRVKSRHFQDKNIGRIRVNHLYTDCENSEEE